MTWAAPTTDLDHLGVQAVQVGAGAVSLRVADAPQAASLAAWLRAADLGVADVVPAFATVLVDGIGDGVDPGGFGSGFGSGSDRWAAVVAAVREWEPGWLSAEPTQSVEIPVAYDGLDLELIARHWQVDVDEVVARHTRTEFVATFSGFSPGFSYLQGLPEAWAVPRLDSPRAQVPAGSVALAHRWCGIYPSASPGGWLLLGHTELAVWDLERVGSPALLVPGTRVRFVVA